METEIIEISPQGVISIDEANRRIRVISRFTQSISAEVNLAMNHLDNLSDLNSEKAKELEKRIDQNIQTWNQKVERLGGISRGLWLVDFDAGDGYYCWKYPEAEIAYWHEYKSGFTGRKPLSHRGTKDSSDESGTSTDQSHTW